MYLLPPATLPSVRNTPAPLPESGISATSWRGLWSLSRPLLSPSPLSFAALPPLTGREHPRVWSDSPHSYSLNLAHRRPWRISLTERVREIMNT